MHRLGFIPPLLPQHPLSLSLSLCVCVLFAQMGKPKLMSMAAPSFFKVMFGDFRTKLIPPCFKKHLGKSIMQRSVLRSSAGREWEIKMGTVDEQIFFQDGWDRFISNNSINLGDFLVFFYDGDVGFDVKIYGTSCCEKRDEFDVKIEAESEEDYDAKRPTKVIRRKAKKITVDKPEGSETCYKIFRGAKVSDKAMKAACAFKSPHPHFVTTCKSTPSCYMRIPAGLAKKYNLNMKNSIDLRDPRGTSWSVKLSTWCDGRLCLSSGWSDLYKENCLKERDACVLEFVQGGTLVNVHIFRAADHIAKSIPGSDWSTSRVTKCEETSTCQHPEKSRHSDNNKNDMKKVRHARKSMDSYNVKIKRFLSADDMTKIPNEAKSFKSLHPTFVIVWRLSRLYHVPIPKKVSRQVSLVENQKTTLIDPSGKSWSTNISVRTSGKVELGVGWSHFSRGNKLAFGDVCIFEFFGGAEYIKVHIFRAEKTNTSAASGIPVIPPC
ncbi:B3 domain-containing protein REM5-like isoform X2 [Asparagus officinalis]|uniref:B3 domain-containing protein REM5-like isoform X2 n=1 Tax=Asparagus officinalis TaxID=4686 RepID=UPI00098E114A|nr:B3 domain-containing protein REM5-like isoform X2 [Asparagus officinalis]